MTSRVPIRQLQQHASELVADRRPAGDASGGKLSYTDGPFTEVKEVVGGYAIIQAKDKAETLEWTRRFLQIHPERRTVTSEVREIAEN